MREKKEGKKRRTTRNEERATRYQRLSGGGGRRGSGGNGVAENKEHPRMRNGSWRDRGKAKEAMGHHARLLWQRSHGDSKSGPSTNGNSNK